MKLSIFYPFGLKTPIYAPKLLGFGGYFTPKMWIIINETQNAHPCVSSRRLSRQA